MSNPSIPPRVLADLPPHPFDQWLVAQAVAGHDRDWLRRNRPMLLKRWKNDDSPLPPPLPAQPKTHDRYSEI
jgi:hypothetical protein